MSIKGFIISGSTQKYDYNGLDNKPVIPPGGGGEVTDALKSALLQLAEKIAYVDANGSAYYDDLYQALYGTAPTTYSVANDLTAVTNSNPATRVAAGGSYSGSLTASTGYTINTVTITMGGNDVTGTSYSGGIITIPNVTGNIVITAVATERTATLLSIDAVFTQGQAVIYNTDSLDSLKQYLVVTANWDDSTTSTVPSTDYTLSGTLTVGTSTITASYSGKTDTFNVTVTQYVVQPIYEWDLTQSLTDTKQSLVCDTTGTFTQGTGLALDTNGMYAGFGQYKLDRTYVFTIEALNRSNNTAYRRFLMTYKTNNTAVYGHGLIYSTSKGGVEFYTGSWQTAIMSSSDISDLDATWTIYTGTDGKWKVYRNGTYIGQSTTAIAENADHTNIWIGSSGNDYTQVLITDFKVYEGEVIS